MESGELAGLIGGQRLVAAVVHLNLDLLQVPSKCCRAVTVTSGHRMMSSDARTVPVTGKRPGCRRRTRCQARRRAVGRRRGTRRLMWTLR